jgi:hypothetical protein
LCISIIQWLESSCVVVFLLSFLFPFPCAPFGGKKGMIVLSNIFDR